MRLQGIGWWLMTLEPEEKYLVEVLNLQTDEQMFIVMKPQTKTWDFEMGELNNYDRYSDYLYSDIKDAVEEFLEGVNKSDVDIALRAIDEENLNLIKEYLHEKN